MPPKSSKGPPSRWSFLIAQEHNILTMTAGQAQVKITVRRETHVSHETLLSRIGTLVTGIFASVKIIVVGVSDQHEAGYNQGRSEEHTSELQSQSNLVCRLLLEKKKKKYNSTKL